MLSRLLRYLLYLRGGRLHCRSASRCFSTHVSDFPLVAVLLSLGCQAMSTIWVAKNETLISTVLEGGKPKTLVLTRQVSLLRPLPL